MWAEGSVHFVSHSFAPVDAPLANVGGMQRVAMELAAELELRDDVALSLDVLRARWDRIGFHAPIFLAGLSSRLRHVSADVVLFASVTSAIAALPVFSCLGARGVRTAAIAHGLDVTHPNPAYRRAVRATLGRLDVVLPVSRATAERCIELGATNVTVVPNGVDLGRFSSAPDETTASGRAREQGHGELVLLAIGRQVPRKGFAWFVREVMARLDPRVRLVLVGDGPEGQAIDRAAIANGVADRVSRLGLCSEAELHARLRDADALVMPNVEVAGDMEGFGIVLLEAGAFGVPVVVADLEGMRDVVVPGRTGELVRSGDADAWVAAIERLRVDRERRRALGTAAQDHVRTTFAWPSVVERYLDLLARPNASGVM
jgi:phosphatidylinositol alpha-1,6-mannosyltransferase